MSHSIQLKGVLVRCSDNGRLSFTGIDENEKAYEDVVLDDLLKEKMRADDRDSIKDVKVIDIKLHAYSSTGP